MPGSDVLLTRHTQTSSRLPASRSTRFDRGLGSSSKLPREPHDIELPFVPAVTPATT